MVTAFVALLRGINVGGRNPVAMPDLADCFRAAGFGDVGTYLQSGNVVFTAASGRADALEADVGRLLTARFGFDIPTVVRSREQFAGVIAAAPPDHGSDDRRSDVMFLKPPLTAQEVLAQMPELRADVDAVAPGPGVVYFSRDAKLATKTRIQRFMSMPVFQQITMRSWSTTTRLATLLAGLPE